MNSKRNAVVALALCVSVGLAGCASSHRATTSSGAGVRPAAPMAPGMTMPDGSIMGAATTAPGVSLAKPSASALMVCSAEIRADVAKVAMLTKAPGATSTFADHLYACTYTLPMGPFIVSVKDLTDSAATTTYFTDLRRGLGSTEDVAGLAEGAYGTPDGKVVLRKDSHVLEVDASHLPAVFGSQSQKRADFAYEIASDILGCWTNG